MGLKQAFENKIEAQLESWDQEIEKTKAEARAKEAQAEEEKADAKLQEQYQQKIQSMQKAYTDVRKKLDGLRKTGDNAWKGLKTDLEATLNHVGDRFKDAGSRLH